MWAVFSKNSTTGAVDAAMLRTGSAGKRKLLFEGLASTMDSDSGVSRGDAGGFGKSFEGIFCQIDAANDLAVLRLKGRKDAFDALADDIVHRGIGLDLGGEVLGPLFESAVFGSAVTVMIDNCIAQDSVEPRYSGLFFLQRRRLFHGANVCALQNVLRRGRSGDAALYELEKFAPLKDEIVDSFGLHGSNCPLEARPGRKLPRPDRLAIYLDEGQGHIGPQGQSVSQGHRLRFIFVSPWSACFSDTEADG